MSKRIAILGAGPSGLVAAKEALQNGLRPTIFEKCPELGGVWNPETGAVWNTMHTNISKFTTTFGDTPYSQDVEMFPSSLSVFEYLKAYAEKWDICNLIKFNTTVIKVQPKAKKSDTGIIGDSGWTVKWTIEGKIDHESDEFDGVIVATGIFAKAHIPDDIPGLSSFPGKVIHSRDYKTGAPFEGQTVLVVGGSFSGSEIAGDISNYTSKTIHSFRQPFWILKRYLPDGSRNKANLPIDLVFYNRKFYSQPQRSLTPEEQCKAKNSHLMSLCLEQQEFPELKVPEEALTKPITTVISDQYLSKVRDHRILPKNQRISEIRGSKVIFDDPSEEFEVDVIIFATGFYVDSSTIFDPEVLEKISYDPEDRLQPLVLFNATVHPDLDNMFFVGMYKGPYFGVMEQQARWACRVISEKVQLPPRSEIEEGLRKEHLIRDQRPRPQFPHPEYVSFADGIAKCGNSLPDLDKLQDDKCSLSEALGRDLGNHAAFLLEGKKNEISRLFMNQPVTPVHYNLVQEPLNTWNQMDFVERVVQQFEN